MKLTVNGVEHEIEGGRLHYDDALRLAGAGMRDNYTVVYRAPYPGQGIVSGSLSPGEWFPISEGTVVNVAYTGNA